LFVRTSSLPALLSLTLVDGTLGLAFVMLTMVIPYQSAQRQRFQIYLWSTIIMLVYSILIVLFKVKNRGMHTTFHKFLSNRFLTVFSGYPFRLLM
jgi:hypothetical protein